MQGFIWRCEVVSSSGARKNLGDGRRNSGDCEEICMVCKSLSDCTFCGIGGGDMTVECGLDLRPGVVREGLMRMSDRKELMV